ncbi:MAG: nucleotidyltransferase family protein, partial [Acidimicrobiales bacterium]
MPTGTVAVAAHGLAGSRRDLPQGPLDAAAWFDLLEQCRSGQLVGFLAATVARGDLVATAGQAEELSVLEAEYAGLSLLVEQRLLTACSLLGAAGIEHRVLDGPARHQVAYAGSGVRTYESAEVLVPADQSDVARRLPGLALRPAESAAHAVARRPRITVRHSVLPESIGATVGIEQLSAGVPLHVADRQLVGLSIDELLVVACVELAVDRFSPRWLLGVRDVAELALSSRLDPIHVRRLAEAWQVAEVVAEMLGLVWQVLDLADKTELSVWALRLGGARATAVPARRRRPAERSAERA